MPDTQTCTVQALYEAYTVALAYAVYNTLAVAYHMAGCALDEYSYDGWHRTDMSIVEDAIKCLAITDRTGTVPAATGAANGRGNRPAIWHKRSCVSPTCLPAPCEIIGWAQDAATREAQAPLHTLAIVQFAARSLSSCVHTDLRDDNFWRASHARGLWLNTRKPWR